MKMEPLFYFDCYRYTVYKDLEEKLKEINPQGIGVEFGGSNRVIQSYMPNVKFEIKPYPPYDVMDIKSYDKEYDVFIADFVLEHVSRPWEVFENIGKTCKMAIITLPGWHWIHYCPKDYWRILPDAIEELAGKYFSKIYINYFGNTTINKAAHYLSTLPRDITQSTVLAFGEEKFLEMVKDKDPVNPFMIWTILQK